MRYNCILVYEDGKKYTNDNYCRELVLSSIYHNKYYKYILLKTKKYHEIRNLSKKLYNLCRFLGDLNIQAYVEDEYIVLYKTYKIPVSLALLLYRRYLRLFDKKQDLNTFITYLLKKSYRPELGELDEIIYLIYYMYFLKYHIKDYDESREFYNGPISWGFNNIGLYEVNFIHFIGQFLDDKHYEKIKIYYEKDYLAEGNRNFFKNLILHNGYYV